MKKQSIRLLLLSFMAIASITWVLLATESFSKGLHWQIGLAMALGALALTLLFRMMFKAWR